MSLRMSGRDRFSNAYGILKLSELTFLLVSMGIFKGADLIFSASHPVAIDTFFSGMFVLGIVITAILFICHLVGQTTFLQQTFLEPLINIIMFIGLAAVGGIVIGCLTSDDGHGLENKAAEAYAMTATTWISSAIYLVDFIYSLIMYKK